jgi:hypothetical protein
MLSDGHHIEDVLACHNLSSGGQACRPQPLAKALLVLSTPQAGHIDKPVDVLTWSGTRVAAPAILYCLNKPFRAPVSLVFTTEMTTGSRPPAHISRVLFR